jgi:hypothetical protein
MDVITERQGTRQAAAVTCTVQAKRKGRPTTPPLPLPPVRPTPWPTQHPLQSQERRQNGLAQLHMARRHLQRRREAGVGPEPTHSRGQQTELCSPLHTFKSLNHLHTLSSSIDACCRLGMHSTLCTMLRKKYNLSICGADSWVCSCCPGQREAARLPPIFLHSTLQAPVDGVWPRPCHCSSPWPMRRCRTGGLVSPAQCASLRELHVAICRGNAFLCRSGLSAATAASMRGLSLDCPRLSSPRAAWHGCSVLSLCGACLCCAGFMSRFSVWLCFLSGVGSGRAGFLA